MLVIIALNFHLYGKKNFDRDNHEALSETPLYPIPVEMTFEEYQDMNRRMSLAIAWSAVPVPGVTHHYAGEKKKARQLFYIGLGGLACVIAGAGSMEEGTWPDTTDLEGDYEKIAGAWYKKVPIGKEGNQTNYKLETVNKESKGSGGGGGRNGCTRPTWSMTIEVLGFRRANSRISPSWPEHITLMGIPALAPPASISFNPLLSASYSFAVSIIRAPTTPGVAAHSAISSAGEVESGLKGLTKPNRPGCFSYTSRA